MDFKVKGKVKTQVQYKTWMKDIELCNIYYVYFEYKTASPFEEFRMIHLHFLLLLFSYIMEGLMPLQLKSGEGCLFKSELWIKERIL